MTDILIAENLVSGYPGMDVVKDVSFTVKRGEFFGIIGPNGAGKSTLLKTLSRVIHPRTGRVAIDGKEISKMPLGEFSKYVAFVSQDTNVSFPFSVLDVALMGRFPYLKLFHSETEKDLEVVTKALEHADCSGLIERPIDQLSSGERQRVFIAKALAQEPRLILLDEPTSHLDISHQVQILDILKDLSEDQGISIIAVFHDLNLASEYCDRMLLMEKGTIAAIGTPNEVLDYKIIEKTYGTVVVVKENPTSKKPYVLLVPRLKKGR